MNPPSWMALSKQPPDNVYIDAKPQMQETCGGTEHQEEVREIPSPLNNGNSGRPTPQARPSPQMCGTTATLCVYTPNSPAASGWCACRTTSPGDGIFRGGIRAAPGRLPRSRPLRGTPGRLRPSTSRRHPRLDASHRPRCATTARRACLPFPTTAASTRTGSAVERDPLGGAAVRSAARAQQTVLGLHTQDRSSRPHERRCSLGPAANPECSSTTIATAILSKAAMSLSVPWPCRTPRTPFATMRWWASVRMKGESKFQICDFMRERGRWQADVTYGVLRNRAQPIQPITISHRMPHARS